MSCKAIREIILASGNPHKAVEFSELLDGFPIVAASKRGGMPEVEETESTFEGNARLKALALLERLPDGVAVLADDSGLEVDALEGGPGVRSARYAGPNADDAANRVKLLAALAGIAPPARTARFRCVLCLMTKAEETSFFDGTCEGRIADTERGDHGFGYDPLFIPEGYGQTFGELPREVKAQLSHRAKAAAKLAAFLAE